MNLNPIYILTFLSVLQNDAGADENKGALHI
jgi:hypothetical protein